MLELDELDDVALCESSCGASKESAIAVELIHHSEVCVTHSHNNDAARQRGSFHNEVLGSRHVVDCSVGQDQQNVVLQRVTLRALTHVGDKLSEDWPEKSWTPKANVALSFSVSNHDVLDALNLRRGNISVKREAVVDSVYTHVSGDATEAEHGEHGRLVVGLDNTSNAVNSAFILVVLAQEVERGRIAGLSVRCGVVNCKNERDLSAALEVVHEGFAFKTLEVVELDHTAVSVGGVDVK